MSPSGPGALCIQQFNDPLFPHGGEWTRVARFEGGSEIGILLSDLTNDQNVLIFPLLFESGSEESFSNVKTLNTWKCAPEKI